MRPPKEPGSEWTLRIAVVVGIFAILFLQGYLEEQERQKGLRSYCDSLFPDQTDPICQYLKEKE